MSILLAVVDQGGFSPAARNLGMTHSAVSKRIKALEERLGNQLISRTTRQMRLTEVGERYVAEAREIESRIASLEQELVEGTDRPHGRLRVTASNAFGATHLVPAAVDFMQKYPEVIVDLTLTDAIVDILQSGMDVAVRSAALADSSLVARKLMENARRVCAAPAYIEAHGRPQRPEDLEQHACLQLNLASSFNTWCLSNPPGATPGTPPGKPLRLGPSFSCNSVSALHASCLAGLGVAWLPLYLCTQDLQEGRLVSLLEEYLSPVNELIYIVRPANNFVPAKTRVFIDFMVDRMQGRPAVTAP